MREEKQAGQHGNPVTLLFFSLSETCEGRVCTAYRRTRAGHAKVAGADDRTEREESSGISETEHGADEF